MEPRVGRVRHVNWRRGTETDWWTRLRQWTVDSDSKRWVGVGAGAHHDNVILDREPNRGRKCDESGVRDRSGRSYSALWPRVSGVSDVVTARRSMCVTAECGYDSRRPDNGAVTRRDDRTNEDAILAVATATLSTGRRTGPHNARQLTPHTTRVDGG